MSLIQLRQGWSRKLARLDLALPDEELARKLAVRRDEIDDFKTLLNELRGIIPPND